MSTQKFIEPRQLSVSISDAFLAASCLLPCAEFWARSAIMGAIIFFSVGLPAALGVLRFTGAFPRIVTQLHQLFSAAGAQVGVPLLGFAIALMSPERASFGLLARVLGVLCFVFALLHSKSSEKTKQLYTSVVGGLALVATIARCAHSLSTGSGLAADAAWAGIGGAVGTIVAGLVITAVGTRQVAGFRVKNVDLFHYALAACYCLFAHTYRALL